MADRCKFKIKNENEVLDIPLMRGWICGWDYYIDCTDKTVRQRIYKDVMNICFIDKLYKAQHKIYYITNNKK